MMQESNTTSEIIKYLIGIIGTIAGSYIVFIVKSISNDIRQLKELLMTHIEDLKTDVERLRTDIIDLYEKHRSSEKDIASAKSDIDNLKNERKNK